MRAVFTPTRGDPFLLAYWTRHLRSWRSEFDRLYLCVSHPVSAPVKVAIRTMLEPGDVVFFSEKPLDHGEALQTMSFVTEETLLLCEDDSFVCNPQAVGATFRVIERAEADVMAAPCHNCSPEILTASTLRRDREPGLNPRMLFARTRNLHDLRTPYIPRGWRAGDEIPYLGGYVAQEDVSCDTFLAASLEIREELAVYELPEETSAWFHAGSLSTPSPFADAPEHAVNGALAEGCAWADRVSWWRRFAEEWAGGIPVHGQPLLRPEYEAYRALVDELVGIVGVDKVDAATARNDERITW